MKNLLIILLLISQFSWGQSFSFTQIPYSDPDIISPGRGAEQWHDGSDRIPNPTSTQSISVENSLDVYHRFQWSQFQGVGMDSNTYNWTFFDNFFIDAINRGQKLSFGIMTVYMDPPNNRTINYDGRQIAYAPFLHDLMKNDANALMRDWGNGNAWIPNPNSPHYLRHLRKLHQAIRNRIMTQSHNGVPFRKVVYCIDIRGYGQYGEWHTGDGMSDFNTYPSTGFPNGMNPTIASLKEIIDTHTEVFDLWPLVIMVAAYNGSGGAPGINIFHQYNEIAHYAMDATNAWGKVGSRRDQVGAKDPYLHQLLENNTTRFPTGVGLTIGQKFLELYKTAPGTGEPMPFVATSTNGMSDVEAQVQLYHPTSFGNGNWIGRDNVNEQNRTWIRAAWKRAGYRLVLTGGNAVVASNFTINLNWQNIGVAPTYESWQVQYILKNGSGTQVWTQNSSFNPKLFLPAAAATTKTDAYSLPAITAGTYGLYVKIVDTAAYRSPLPLAIQGRQSDGSYFLANVTFGTTANRPPVANAGPNQTITLPDTDAVLTGVLSSDPDGTVASYAWSQVTGPNTATFSATNLSSVTVSNLIAGTYTFNLTVTDNSGSISSDQVNIIVNPGTPPVANAGPNQSITLPTSSVTVNGSGSSDDISIASYAWSKVNGPTSYTITSPTSVSTTITGLTAGVYTFRLTVTDGGGLTHTDDVQITVVNANQAPVANAGANQSITLPTSSVTLNGSASTDDVSISSYLWTKVGGPSTFTIASPTSVSTNITGLVAGVYIFRLQVVDGAGLSSTDDVQVTVNTSNLAPVANAGANQIITLPTSSVTLNGSGSSDDVGVVSYLWTKVSGGAATIVSSTSVSTSVTGLVQGVYQFRLRVTDGAGLTNTDDIQITVNAAANNAPVANAGVNQSITLPTSSVTVNGSGSTDDVGIVSYLWSKVSGTGGTIASPTSSSSNITGLTAGTYVYRLTVTDAGNLSSTDDIQIIVNPAANAGPLAEAGNSHVITLPTSSVSLNGTGSTDDVGIVTYAWTKLSGPLSSTIVSPSSATTNVTGLTEGTYYFTLTVTDAGGLTDNDVVQVTVIRASATSNTFWQWVWRFLRRY